MAEIEEMFPQLLPYRPFVAAGNRVAGGRREAFGDPLHASGEAVLAAVADEDRQAGRRALQPAPHAEFRIGQFFRCRLPVIEAAGAVDGAGR